MSRRAAFVPTVFAAMLAGMTAIPAMAQDGSADFSFKRVKPPSANTKKRINIQVERTWPYRDEVTPDAPKATPQAPESPDGWFWAAISDKIEAADPIRLDRALTTLNANPSKLSTIAPNAAVMDRIVREQGPNILLATAGKRISPAFALAVIAVESAGHIDAVSPKGAQGLMQLIPATAQRFGVEDINDPRQNITGGVAYLDWLFGQFGGDPILSLAGYNAGENAVIKNNGVPPYAETRAYIPRVVAAWDQARRYCKTIPKFADDGCVFDLNRSFSN